MKFPLGQLDRLKWPPESLADLAIGQHLLEGRYPGVGYLRAVEGKGPELKPVLEVLQTGIGDARMPET